MSQHEQIRTELLSAWARALPEDARNTLRRLLILAFPEEWDDEVSPAVRAKAVTALRHFLPAEILDLYPDPDPSN